ncbi:MAG: sulfite exporter TauE/SafE family protein [Gammaproteobacteria bacterium]|nr:sulfite exporter TauE/SafE family protein [Gammaproteobacteria bacterium]
MSTDILMLLGMGALAGTLAGLLGIGGGIIIVPVLALVFQHQGVESAALMHVAIGTSLGTIVVTSLSSIRAHHRRGAIQWPVFRYITPGIIVGGFIGAAVAEQLPGETLRLAFSIFMLLVAAQMALGNAAKPHRTLPGRVGLAVAGLVIGSVSALMGVGGGSMSVPFLTWCNMAVRNAVATSAAIGLPIALSGSIGFIISGWSAAARPAWSLGYVNLPAFLGIVVASTLFAPLGARLAHTIPERTLKRVFAAFLTVLGLKLLLG